LLLLCRVQRRLAVDLQELGEAENRIEGRPELVAHRREELALRGARRFGQLLRLRELGFVLRVVGDVPDRGDGAALERATVGRPQRSAVARAGLERTDRISPVGQATRAK